MIAAKTDPKEVIELLKRSGYNDIEVKNGSIKIGYWERMNSFDQTKFFATLEEEIYSDRDCGTLYSYKII